MLTYGKYTKQLYLLRSLLITYYHSRFIPNGVAETLDKSPKHTHGWMNCNLMASGLPPVTSAVLRTKSF
jgi:hypothetical protein